MFIAWSWIPLASLILGDSFPACKPDTAARFCSSTCDCTSRVFWCDGVHAGCVAAEVAVDIECSSLIINWSLSCEMSCGGLALQTQRVTQLKKPKKTPQNPSAVRPVPNSPLISAFPLWFLLPVLAGLDLHCVLFVISQHQRCFMSPFFCPAALPLSSPSSFIRLLNPDVLPRHALMPAVLCQQARTMLLLLRTHNPRESFDLESISTLIA